MLKGRMRYMRLAKSLILFSIGGIAYLVIEIIFRGYSHLSMFFVGGLCFIFMGWINEAFSSGVPMIVKMFLSTLIITTIEFVSGCILNLRLGLHVWNYSKTWGNVLGQISIPFMLAWFLLSGAGILLDNLLRHIIFNEKISKYKPM